MMLSVRAINEICRVWTRVSMCLILFHRFGLISLPCGVIACFISMVLWLAADWDSIELKTSYSAISGIGRWGGGRRI